MTEDTRTDIIIHKVGEKYYECSTPNIGEGKIASGVIGHGISPIEALRSFNMGLWENYWKDIKITKEQKKARKKEQKKARKAADIAAAGGWWNYYFANKK